MKITFRFKGLVGNGNWKKQKTKHQKTRFRGRENTFALNLKRGQFNKIQPA